MNPKRLARFHLVAMITWLLLIIPTVLIWKESILWIGFMSAYALFVGHFAGYDAARADRDLNERLDRIEKGLGL